MCSNRLEINGNQSRLNMLKATDLKFPGFATIVDLIQAKSLLSSDMEFEHSHSVQDDNISILKSEKEEMSKQGILTQEWSKARSKASRVLFVQLNGTTKKRFIRLREELLNWRGHVMYQVYTFFLNRNKEKEIRWIDSRFQLKGVVRPQSWTQIDWLSLLWGKRSLIRVKHESCERKKKPIVGAYKVSLIVNWIELSRV